MAPESVEFEIQQVDGQKNKEPAWRDNPVLHNKNHKDYGNKAVTKKVFAPILAFSETSSKSPFQIFELVSKPSSGEYQLSQSKFLSFAPSCVF